METKEYEVPRGGCSWCVKEVGFLHKASKFSPQDIQAYTSFYGVFGDDLKSVEDISGDVGYCCPDDTQEAIREVADWLMANSPYRSLPRRCSVCEHAVGFPEVAHLKETPAKSGW